MAKTKSIKSVAFRLDAQLARRIEAAQRRLASRVPGVRVTWSDVVRGLVESGLDRDEENANIARPTRSA